MRRDQQGDGYHRHDQDRDHRTLETRQVLNRSVWRLNREKPIAYEAR
jgi:hypothetical protein